MRSGVYCAFGLAFAGVTGSALEPADLFLIQKGPMVLKPQLNVSTIFSDNVTFVRDHKISDVSAVISPGFGLQLGTLDYNYIDVSYFFDRLQYFDHTEFDANQHRFGIDLRFEKSRFTLTGHDRIQFLSSPLGGGYSLGGLVVDRTSYWDEYRLTYSLSDKTEIYGEATHSELDYEKGIGLYDSRTLIGSLGFGYQGFSRTFFFGEVYYGQTENDPNASSLLDYPTARFVGGFLGVRGSFTDNLSGQVKAGYESREYSGLSQGTSAPVVEASLTERFSERTLLTGSYSRRQFESVQFLRSTYVNDSVALNLRQDIGSEGRLRANLKGAYSISSYEPSPQFIVDRTDHLVTAGLTITYDIKLWMRVFGGYDFEWLDSSEPRVVDYTVNRVTLGLELGY